VRSRALPVLLSAVALLTVVLTFSFKALAQNASYDLTRDDTLPAPAVYAAFANIEAIDPSTGEIERIGALLPFVADAMLANPSHARIYLFERVGSRIAVVSTRSLEVLTTITVPQGLAELAGTGWLAISPSGNRIYVVDQAQDGIDIISTRSLAVEAFVPVGEDVSGLAVSNFGNRVYISLPKENRIAILDASTDRLVGSFLEGLCLKRGFIVERCEVDGLMGSTDGRYVLCASGRTGTVAAFDTIDNKLVGDTEDVFFRCPEQWFVGFNQTANQAALFTEGCARESTEFVSAVPPFNLVEYSFPPQKFDGAFTVAFDPTGTIGYAAGDQRFDHGELLQFTSQTHRFIPIGSPSALVLAP